MENKGLIFVVSGPAGSGKGTVVSLLRETTPKLGVSVSATTREPRPGEIDGVSYHFVSREKFLELIENGEILEHTEYCGNYYGTLVSEARRILSDGKDLILEIEVEGALQVKKLMPEDTVTVMLIAPSRDEQERRLRGRGTESDEVIARRIKRAEFELSLAESYDYILTNENGKSDECAQRLKAIISAEHNRYARMKSLIDEYSRPCR